MAEFMTGAANSALTILETSDVFLVPGATRFVDFQEAIAEAGLGFSTRLRIDGTILCANFTAIVLRSDGLAADQVVIGSAGQVHAVGGVGVRMFGAGARFINDGEVSGDTGAVIALGIFSTVENRGLLTGNAVDGAGLSVENGESFVQVNNAGTIAGYNGIAVGASYIDLLNTGTIRATDGNGLALDFNLAFSSCTVRNFGVIEAPVAAFQDSGSDDLIVNAGRITGDVVYSAGDDTFRGKSGVLAGVLFGGTGNDRLASGTGDDEVYGDEGNDILRGNDGDDSLFGGQGKDTLRGDAGGDTLSGGNSADVFLFTRTTGDDRIDDFANGSDRIDLTVLHFAGFAAVSALASDRPGGMLIDLSGPGGGTIFVAGFLKASFDAGDVIL